MKTLPVEQALHTRQSAEAATMEEIVPSQPSWGSFGSLGNVLNQEGLLKRQRERTESAEAEVPMGFQGGAQAPEPLQQPQTSPVTRGLRRVFKAATDYLSIDLFGLSKKLVKDDVREAGEIVNLMPLSLVDALCFWLLTHAFKKVEGTDLKRGHLMTLAMQKAHPRVTHVYISKSGYQTPRPTKGGGYVQWAIPPLIREYASQMAVSYPEENLSVSEWRGILNQVAGAQPMLHQLFYRFQSRGKIPDGYDVSHLMRKDGFLSCLIPETKVDNEKRKPDQSRTWNDLVNRQGQYTCRHQPLCIPCDWEESIVDELKRKVDAGLDPIALETQPDLQFIYPLPAIFSPTEVNVTNHWDAARLLNPQRHVELPQPFRLIPTPKVQFVFPGSGGSTKAGIKKRLKG